MPSSRWRSTPDGEASAEDVQTVSTKMTIGPIGILADHAPLLAMPDPPSCGLYRV